MTHYLERVRSLKVGELISPPILFPPSTPVSKIVGVLKDVYAYEAFIEEKGRISMVTLRDVLKASNNTSAKAENLAFHIPKLKPGSLVHEASRLMMENRIRALPS